MNVSGESRGDEIDRAQVLPTALTLSLSPLGRHGEYVLPAPPTVCTVQYCTVLYDCDRVEIYY